MSTVECCYSNYITIVWTLPVYLSLRYEDTHMKEVVAHSSCVLHLQWRSTLADLGVTI